MTKKEQELILALSLKSISKPEFSKEYGIGEGEINGYVYKSLQATLVSRDADAVEYSLLLGFVFDIFSVEWASLLSQLLQGEWHFKHEDIVVILQSLKSPNIIAALYDTALKKFDYREYDDSYSLARKCIHALGDINTEEAREKLKLLAQSDIPIIREKAEKQLHYYKR